MMYIYVYTNISIHITLIIWEITKRFYNSWFKLNKAKTNLIIINNIIFNNYKRYNFLIINVYEIRQNHKKYVNYFVVKNLKMFNFYT